MCELADCCCWHVGKHNDDLMIGGRDTYVVVGDVIVQWAWPRRCTCWRGVRSFGRQFFSQMSIWATRNWTFGRQWWVVWATKVNRYIYSRTGQGRVCTRSLAVIICFSTHFSKVHRRFNNTQRLCSLFSPIYEMIPLSSVCSLYCLHSNTSVPAVYI